MGSRQRMPFASPGARLRRTTNCCSCKEWKAPACGEFTIADCRKPAHRPIDPSEGHGVGFRWPDDPMVRWPDYAALHDVLETKGVSV